MGLKPSSGATLAQLALAEEYALRQIRRRQRLRQPGLDPGRERRPIVEHAAAAAPRRLEVVTLAWAQHVAPSAIERDAAALDLEATVERTDDLEVIVPVTARGGAEAAHRQTRGAFGLHRARLS
jgi:hypothetical protein